MLEAKTKTTGEALREAGGDQEVEEATELETEQLKERQRRAEKDRPRIRRSRRSGPEGGRPGGAASEVRNGRRPLQHRRINSRASPALTLAGRFAPLPG